MPMVNFTPIHVLEVLQVCITFRGRSECSSNLQIVAQSSVGSYMNTLMSKCKGTLPTFSCVVQWNPGLSAQTNSPCMGGLGISREVKEA